ncbi:MAG TPA: hypothetical protein VMS17_31655 [Gemmataceae bacterium]|nr:hypothetical protein [Gemmataceae bacterium]
MSAFADRPFACYRLSVPVATPRPIIMERFLDNLFDGLKPLEGRLIPRGWSAGLVAGSVLLFAGLLVVIAFLVV